MFFCPATSTPQVWTAVLMSLSNHFWVPFFSSLLFKIMTNYWSHWRVCKEKRSRNLTLIIWCEFSGGTFIGFNSLATCFNSLADVLPLFKVLLLGCLCLHRKGKWELKWNFLPLAAASPYGQNLASICLLFLNQVMKIDSSTFEINIITA